MRKRPRLWIASGLAACVIAVGITWWTWPTPQINVARFREVREGMKLPEVEAIVGGPPGVYCAGGVTGSYLHGPFTGEDFKKTGGREWVGKGWSMIVIFGFDGRATRVHTGLTTMRRPFLQSIREWLDIEEPPVRRSRYLD